MPVIAVSNALCTTDDVKAYGVAGSQDSSGDQAIQRLINMATEAIHDHCQREFVSLLGTGARKFGYDGGSLLRFGKWDAQSVSSVVLDTDRTSPVTIPTTAYQLLPIDKPHGVYNRLKFYTFTIGDPLRIGAGMDREMTITGTWGFPSVPEAVKQACIITCVVWLRRDLQYLTRTYDAATGNVLPVRAGSLPDAATSLLIPFRRF